MDLHENPIYSHSNSYMQGVNSRSPQLPPPSNFLASGCCSDCVISATTGQLASLIHSEFRGSTTKSSYIIPLTPLTNHHILIPGTSDFLSRVHNNSWRTKLAFHNNDDSPCFAMRKVCPTTQESGDMVEISTFTNFLTLNGFMNIGYYREIICCYFEDF